MIVAAVGKNASGKDYFLDVIAKQFDIPVISFGDCARELADKEGLVHTRENLQYISKKYMSTYGQDFFPKMMVEKIRQMGLKNVLVSGIRPPSDAELFRQEFGDDFFLVAIVLESDRLRYERMVARGSARDNVTYEQFINFHKTLYHPSNSYIFVYGDCDMDERLEWMDKNYPPFLPINIYH